MKIIFRKWIPEENDYQKEQSTLKNKDLIEALISTLHTISNDLDEHLNKDNENNENI